MEDIGSWVLMSRAPNPYVGDPAEATESWYGLSKDLDKLPHTGGTGSTGQTLHCLHDLAGRQLGLSQLPKGGGEERVSRQNGGGLPIDNMVRGTAAAKVVVIHGGQIVMN